MAIQTKSSRRRMASMPVGAERRGESGASLVIALAVVLFLGVLGAAVLSYSETAYTSSKGFDRQRSERYAGDGAINAAIGWIKNTEKVALDPKLSPDPCVFYSPTDAGTVTVSCAANEGSGSGKPVDVGLSPPESLLLLGTRQDSPGPYNYPSCAGWWDTFTSWFQSGIDPNETGPAEFGAWFKKRTGLGALNASCSATRSRSNDDLLIDGNVNAAGRIVTDDDLKLTLNGSSRAWAKAGCSGSITPSCLTSKANRTGSGTTAYLNNTAPDTDPGRVSPNAPKSNPVGDTATPFLPVGFNADGTPKNLTTPQGAAYSMPATSDTTTMPARNTAYLWTAATGSGVDTFTATSTCPNNTATIVFLPGWYKDSETLSKYTTNANCRDVNFWFAPNPGPDGRLLTADDVTGAFYLDFTDGSGRTCGPAGMPANKNRWCIGGSSDQNARIIVGTPKNWSPVGDITAGTGGAPTTTEMVINSAQTVDLDLSQSWFDNPAAAARTIDGTAARYQADACIIWCFSSDRAIRLRDMAPDATSAPVAESGATKGRLYLTVKYSVENPGSANAAEAVIEAVSSESGRHSCGTYTLFGNSAAAAPYNNKANANAGNPNSPSLFEYKFTAQQAKDLADRCGTVDLINGLEVKVQVRGNAFNSPNRTNWWLDGVKLSYQTLASASFPVPVGTNPDGLPANAAKTDCDPDQAGGQLIFGGASHMYVLDGSVEICAGPHPDDPDNKQSIGIWAMPAFAEVAPTGITGRGGSGTYDQDCFLGACSWWRNPLNEGNVTAIDKQAVTLRYGTPISVSTIDAWVDVGFPAITSSDLPSGYKISKIEARVSYNPKNQNCSFLWDCPGANAQFEPRIGSGTSSCGTINMPKNPDAILQVANWNSTVLYSDNGSRNCINVAANGASAPASTIRWKARAAGGLGSSYTDQLDGIMYSITIEPTSTTTARLKPQSGCIVAWPNYNAGYGNPDCALVRAETGEQSDNFTWPWAQKEGQWRGRVSVRGTIYAPSSAIEVDDTDIGYPLATRGVILRHLRVSGWGIRSGYNLPVISNTLNRDRAPREATLVACVQSADRRVARNACDAALGDRVLSQARVLFKPIKSGSTTNWEASVQWWENER